MLFVRTVKGCRPLRDILEIEACEHRADGALVKLEPRFGKDRATRLEDRDHHREHERIAADGVALGVEQCLDVRRQLLDRMRADAVLDNLLLLVRRQRLELHVSEYG